MPWLIADAAQHIENQLTTWSIRPALSLRELCHNRSYAVNDCLSWRGLIASAQVMADTLSIVLPTLLRGATAKNVDVATSRKYQEIR